MEAWRRKVGLQLRRLREARGWTRQNVYDELRDRGLPLVPTTTLEKWERGSSEPTASKLAGLAVLYEISLEDAFLVDELRQPSRMGPSKRRPPTRTEGRGLRAVRRGE